jgi:hypothetical protein
LPTETWREHVARRQRCLDIREKLRRGEVHQINDVVTLNLDIWKFARDAIVNSEGPELLIHQILPRRNRVAIAGPPRAGSYWSCGARHNFVTVGGDRHKKRTQDQAITPCSCVSYVD